MFHSRFVGLAFLFLFLRALTGAGVAATANSPLHLPQDFRGQWFAGPACSDVKAYAFRGDGWTIGIEEFMGRIFAGRAEYSVLKIKQDGSVLTSVYAMEPSPPHKWVPATTLFRMANGRLQTSTNGRSNIWIRCDNPEVHGHPWSLYALYLSDLTNLLTSIQGLQSSCEEGAGPCYAAMLNILDLNHDGKVSTAELVNFLRRASKLGLLIGHPVPGTKGAISTARLTPDQIVGAEFGTALVGPVVANVIMDNIDYDGDGFIQKDELEAFLRQFGMPVSPSRLGGLLPVVRSGLSQAATSLGSLKQLLGMFGGR